MGKAAHLGSGRRAGDADAEPRRRGRPTVVGVFTVTNPHGLHARPAARLVQRGARGSTPRSRCATSPPAPAGAGGEPEPGRDARRAARPRGRGAGLRTQAQRGPRAPPRAGRAAVRRGRTDGRGRRRPPAAGRRPAGGRAGPLPASPGIGDRPGLRRLRAAPVEVPDDPDAGDPAARVATRRRGGRRRCAATSSASARRDRPRGRARRRPAIFDAHLLLLDDAELLATSSAGSTPAQAAAAAWAGCLADVERAVGRAPRPLPARARRRRARGRRPGAARACSACPPADARAAGVLVAADLTPAEAAELDRDRVDGDRAGRRQPDLARRDPGPGRGIPAVVGAGPRGARASPRAPSSSSTAPPARSSSTRRPTCWLTYRDAGRRAGRAPRSSTCAEAARRRSPATASTSWSPPTSARSADARAALAAGADVGGPGPHRVPLPRPRARRPTSTSRSAEYRADRRGAGRPARSPCARWTSAATSRCRTCRCRRRPTRSSACAASGSRSSGRELLRDQLAAHVPDGARRTRSSVMFPMVVDASTSWSRPAQVLDEAAGPAGAPRRPAGRDDGRGAGGRAEDRGVRCRTWTSSASAPTTSPSTRWPPSAATPPSPALGRRARPRRARGWSTTVCRAAAGRVAGRGLRRARRRRAARSRCCVGLGVRELSVSPQAVPAVKRAVRGLDLLDCADLAARALDATGPAQVAGAGDVGRRAASCSCCLII